jgi:hypothetical protein
MNKSQLLAQLRAAMWALVGLIGYADAKREIEAALGEIESKEWDRSGGGR